jgi:hypothetical protein
LSGFFHSRLVLATGFVAAILGIAQFVAPYLLSPASLQYAPAAGVAFGGVMAFVVNYFLREPSLKWAWSRINCLFISHAVLFVIILLLQVVVSFSSQAEIAQSFVWTNRLHGLIIMFWGFLPQFYFMVVAVSIYFALSSCYWFYRRVTWSLSPGHEESESEKK